MTFIQIFFQLQTVASDNFKLGLVFFYLFTDGKSALTIATNYFKETLKHEVKINLKPLDILKFDTECILFIDLIVKMVQEEPKYRESCDNLINHAFFKGKNNRLKIVRKIANECFDMAETIYPNLVINLDKHEVHYEGFLGEDSAPWQKFLTGASSYPEKPDIKTCSSLIKFVSKQVIQSLDSAKKVDQLNF